MRMDRFDYELPPDRIAQFPAARRDESRLLIVDRRAGTWRDATFPDLADALAAGDLLVVNETAVFPARLRARRPGGGEVELLLTRPLDADDPREAGGSEWAALARPARKARAGEPLELLERTGEPAAVARAIVTGAEPGGVRHVRLEVPGDPWEWIEAHGHVPLPPYIARPDLDEDRARYQTVYARLRGAVAAPTAGLHFTPELLARLNARGVERAALTLHVGPGTFRPVTAERADEHVMDREWYRIPEETGAAIARSRTRGNRVVAVGTTTVRALETAGRQWARPDDPAGGPAAVAGWTDLFIRPGHEFQWVNAVVTNFHLPRSTLLLLVAAFAGTDLVLAAYRHAVEAGYRFYSYGDAMVIV
jgi:S-adenosylmethionine:tRNA ribosyltransferase-isomerase